MKRRNECIMLYLWFNGQKYGELYACDVHGNSRSNKAWVGFIDGKEIELPNLKAVAAWAKEHNISVERR